MKFETQKIYESTSIPMWNKTKGQSVSTEFTEEVIP